MIELEAARSKAQKLAEGFTLISIRENDEVWLFEYKYYPGKTGADGTDVVVSKVTGKASHVAPYSDEGYRLFINTKTIQKLWPEKAKSK